MCRPGLADLGRHYAESIILVFWWNFSYVFKSFTADSSWNSLDAFVLYKVAHMFE